MSKRSMLLKVADFAWSEQRLTKRANETGLRLKADNEGLDTLKDCFQVTSATSDPKAADDLLDKISDNLT